MCEYDALQSSPEVKVEMAARDAALAANELVRLRNDPETSALVARQEGDLWSTLNALQLVVTSIRAELDSKRSAA